MNEDLNRLVVHVCTTDNMIVDLIFDRSISNFIPVFIRINNIEYLIPENAFSAHTNQILAINLLLK